MIKNIPNINATWNDPNPFRGGVGFSCYGNDERFYGSNGKWKMPTQIDDGWGNLNTAILEISERSVIQHLQNGWYCSKWEQAKGRILPFGYVHILVNKNIATFVGVLLGVKIQETKYEGDGTFVQPGTWYFWTAQGLVSIAENDFLFIQPIGQKRIYDYSQMAYSMLFNFYKESDEEIMEILNLIYRNPLLRKLEWIAKEFSSSSTPFASWIQSKGYATIGFDALGTVLEEKEIEPYFDVIFDSTNYVNYEMQ